MSQAIKNQSVVFMVLVLLAAAAAFAFLYQQWTSQFPAAILYLLLFIPCMALLVLQGPNGPSRLQLPSLLLAPVAVFATFSVWGLMLMVPRALWLVSIVMGLGAFFGWRGTLAGVAIAVAAFSFRLV